MEPETLAVFIPIVMFIGLFAVIALNIYFKYKTRELMANRTGSPDDWHKAEVEVKLAQVEARARRRDGVVLRIIGLLAGIGLGVAIGSILVATVAFDGPVAVFLIIALAMFFGGAGMTGAYFLERRLNRNSK